MKKLIVLAAILTIATASLSGCSQAQPAEDTDQTTPTVEEPADNSAEITPAATDKSFEDLVMNPYSINDASIEGDIMTVTVSYSGCSKDKFQAYWTGTFMESYPVQSSILLTRGTELYEVTCQMYIEHTIEINLATLKRQYKNSYQTDTGTIMLSVTDGKNENGTVEYEF